MRKLITATVLSLGLTASALADEGAIQGVIGDQIEAFLADDFERAFTHASPMIQGLFGSPERFGMMVRSGYPMVWRPAKVEYLGLTAIGGRYVQEVMITDQTGALHLLAYQMIQTEAGWLINAVQVLKSPEVGA